MALPARSIDTLAIAKELEASGVPKEQAEAQTRVYAKMIDTVVGESLVTKEDLREVKSDINARIDALDKSILKLDNGIKNATLRITVRLGSLMVAGVIVLAAIIKF